MSRTASTETPVVAPATATAEHTSKFPIGTVVKHSGDGNRKYTVVGPSYFNSKGKEYIPCDSGGEYPNYFEAQLINLDEQGLLLQELKLARTELEGARAELANARAALAAK